MANYKVTRYPHGCFSWADASVNNQEAGKAFYTAVMGWQATDTPIDDNSSYTMFKVDGENVAGLGQMPPEMEGSPSLWMCYVNVDDVDAIVAKSLALGATLAMPAMDVMTEGRMAMIQDPTGAHIGFWQAANHIGAGLVNTYGAMSWNELLTPDVDKAKAFYGDLLGWEFQVGHESSYTVIMNNGRMNGGLMALDPDWGVPPSWGVYFTVPNLSTVLEKVEQAGGSLMMPIHKSDMGTFATIKDVTGAVFSISEIKDEAKIDEWKE